MSNTIDRMEIYGSQLWTAEERLAYVCTLIEGRCAELAAQAVAADVPAAGVRYVGPTFVVDLHDVPTLFGRDGCRRLIESIVGHSGRHGVLVRLHVHRADLAVACTQYGVRGMLQALALHRSVQLITPPHVAPGAAGSGPSTEAPYGVPDVSVGDAPGETSTPAAPVRDDRVESAPTPSPAGVDSPDSPPSAPDA